MQDPALRKNAAGQNNSNPTPFVASVTYGEWELLFGIVPIIVLYGCLVINPTLPIAAVSHEEIYLFVILCDLCL